MLKYCVLITALPGAPIEVRASEVTATTVRLAWTYNGPEEPQYYVIQYKPKYANQVSVKFTKTLSVLFSLFFKRCSFLGCLYFIINYYLSIKYYSSPSSRLYMILFLLGLQRDLRGYHSVLFGDESIALHGIRDVCNRSQQYRQGCAF